MKILVNFIVVYRNAEFSHVRILIILIPYRCKIECCICWMLSRPTPTSVLDLPLVFAIYLVAVNWLLYSYQSSKTVHWHVPPAPSSSSSWANTFISSLTSNYECCCLLFRLWFFIVPIDDNLRGLVVMDATDSSSIAITATTKVLTRSSQRPPTIRRYSPPSSKESKECLAHFFTLKNKAE